MYTKRYQMVKEIMEEKKELMLMENIRNQVYVIRGQQVMLDSDLAELYGYEVKKLNQQVKRNVERFPEDFMFQLSREEVDLVKSQIVTSPNQNLFSGQNGGRRKLPYVFTEQGVYMLATVLHGELAERQSVYIMRAFREMRHYIKQNQQFVAQSELDFLASKVTNLSMQVTDVLEEQKNTNNKINTIEKCIDDINENFVSEKDWKEFVIYKNKKFEADVAYIDIYQQATKSIFVVDDYLNTKSLELLSQKREGVDVILFTENGHGRNGFLTQSVIDDFVSQYPSLHIKPNPDSHDRWIVLDYGTSTEKVFHCGTSSKDAGRKVCAINKLENSDLIHPMIDILLQGEDKKIR